MHWREQGPACPLAAPWPWAAGDIAVPTAGHGASAGAGRCGRKRSDPISNRHWAACTQDNCRPQSVRVTEGMKKILDLGFQLEHWACGVTVHRGEEWSWGKSAAFRMWRDRTAVLVKHTSEDSQLFAWQANLEGRGSLGDRDKGGLVRIALEFKVVGRNAVPERARTSPTVQGGGELGSSA